MRHSSSGGNTVYNGTGIKAMALKAMAN